MVYDGVLGEGARLQGRHQVLPFFIVEAGLLVQGPGGVAHVAAPRQAVAALAAGHQQRKHDGVARLDRGDPLADGLHVAGRLVPPDEGELPGELALEQVDIAVADGRGRQLHLDLALLGRVDSYLFYHQGFTVFVTDRSFQFSLLKISPS